MCRRGVDSAGACITPLESAFRAAHGVLSGWDESDEGLRGLLVHGSLLMRQRSNTISKRSSQSKPLGSQVVKAQGRMFKVRIQSM